MNTKEVLLLVGALAMLASIIDGVTVRRFPPWLHYILRGVLVISLLIFAFG